MCAHIREMCADGVPSIASKPGVQQASNVNMCHAFERACLHAPEKLISVSMCMCVHIERHYMHMHVCGLVFSGQGALSG